MSDVVLSIGRWRNNAELMVDVARLGYLTDEMEVLDPTYGLGRFWTHYRPANLTASDLDPAKSPLGRPVDFRDLPWPPGSFDAVVLDGPYKLNGTPSGSDEDYGVHVVASWQERLQVILDGVAECVRVLRVGGTLLVKCQDQVCSGKVRWQTDAVTRAAEDAGCRKVDRFDLPSYRPQPEGRRQVHARRNASTLLIFERTADVSGQLTLEPARSALDVATTEEVA